MDFDKYKIQGIEPLNEVRFKSLGVELLRLDEHGFHYKGETIDDAGEAYELFTAWLRMTKIAMDDKTLSPDDIV